MLAKEITYKEFEGTERTETHYFHFSESEVMEMEMSITGGLAKMLERIIAAQDAPEIMRNFKEIILKSYGIKSPDGKRFEKSEEISTAFSQTGAYDKLFMELVTNTKAATDFINAVIPNKPNPAAQAVPAPAGN